MPHQPSNPTPSDPTHEADDWERYHAATRDLPPRSLLVEALALLPKPGNALDLGCGAGNDTRHLLAAGFRVTAVDANLAAVEALQSLGEERLTVIHGMFADFPIAPTGYDLISAQYALPFNPPATFEVMFARLVTALKPGGIFTGHLFGVRDAWNVPGSSLSFHTREQAGDLLRDLEIIVFREVEQTIQLASGDLHEAHDFEIIAGKP